LVVQYLKEHSDQKDPVLNAGTPATGMPTVATPTSGLGGDGSTLATDGKEQPSDASLAAIMAMLPTTTPTAQGRGAGGSALPSASQTLAIAMNGAANASVFDLAALERMLNTTSAGTDHAITVTPPAAAGSLSKDTKAGVDTFISTLAASASTTATPAEAPSTGGGNAMSGLQAAPSAFTARAPSLPGAPATLEVHTPVGTRGWDTAMAASVAWQATEKVQEAQIKLNPPELGPVEVRLHMDGDKASVQFIAHSATTRAALEDAMPQLRDMLASSGLHLADSSVSSQSSEGRDQPGAENGAGRAGNLVEEEVVGSGVASIRVPEGLLDAYA
jgi:flagellar hook-length control protein FliK